MGSESPKIPEPWGFLERSPHRGEYLSHRTANLKPRGPRSLQRSVVLPATCLGVPSREFTGPNGAKINVRVRVPALADEQETPGAPISIDGIDEKSVGLTVHHYYSACNITDEDSTLNLQDFGSEVLEPMTSAIATKSEDTVASIMNSLEPSEFYSGEDDIVAAILAARTQLGRNGVPSGARWLACSPEATAALLSVPNLQRVDASGSPSALRDALIGRLFGFNAVESAALDAGVMVAYHSSACAFVSRAPAIPDGAASASVSMSTGFGIRYVSAFDVGTLSDVAALSTFCGASVIAEDGDDESGAPGVDIKRAVAIGHTS